MWFDLLAPARTETMPRSQFDAKAYRLVGYFPSWVIHAENYHVADIPTDRLTHIIYAFADVTAGGECASIHARDDQVNFPQLAQLNQQYPQIMTLISVGGGANSANFPSAATSAAGRAKLAQSCIAFMRQNGFDGIDIDWEYPSAQDTENYTALLLELRSQLDSQAAADGRHYLLTIAAPAGPHNYAHFQLDRIHASLDWINLMTYNFHVPSSKVANFVAPLYPASDDPAPAAIRLAFNVDAAVKAYLSAGVPAEKVVVGMRFVGTGWQGVPNTNNGLYQSNSGPAPGTWQSGSFDYGDLETNYLGSYTRFWHSEAQVPWLYNPSTGVFITYEDPQSLQLKAGYVITNQLGGAMIWQLSADDAQQSLVNALAGALAGQPAGGTGLD
jgi:chitinase